MMISRHLITFSLLTLLLVTACSGGQSAATATPTITPTAFPTFAFVQPTLAPAVAEAATAVAATAAAGGDSFVLDPEKVERGLSRWEALECGSCHGENGEGTDDGAALVDYAADEAAFIDFLRTGGDLGGDHRFPAERLSNSGISNLYHYVRSLGEE
jgi:mono/diheme cytochrome c family protein